MESFLKCLTYFLVFGTDAMFMSDLLPVAQACLSHLGHSVARSAAQSALGVSEPSGGSSQPTGRLCMQPLLPIPKEPTQFGCPSLHPSHTWFSPRGSHYLSLLSLLHSACTYWAPTACVLALCGQQWVRQAEPLCSRLRPVSSLFCIYETPQNRQRNS